MPQGILYIIWILAVNMVNGMSVNGLGEVSMDTTQTVISNNLIANNLIALGKQDLCYIFTLSYL